MMINLVRPKFFVPVHGDYRHLKRHVELAIATGVPEKVLLLEDGDVLTLDKESAQKTGKVTTGRVCIDNNSTADVVEDTVIRDRKHIGEDGVFLPIIAINRSTGKVEGQPEIATRGFVADDPELLRNARDIVVRTLQDSSDEERRDYGVMKDKIRGDLKRFLQKNANRRPLIMPIILEL
jgi:ribonuclease J